MSIPPGLRQPATDQPRHVCIVGQGDSTDYSDTTITESARFVFEAQEYLQNHPGRMGFPALNRATAAQQTANDKARSAPCAALKLITPVVAGAPKTNCDEFPFQTTARGAASGIIKLNWDIRMVNGEQNQKVGSMLSILYTTERFWYGDHFYVQFTP